MKVNMAIKQVLRYKKTTQTNLAERMGYASQAGIAELLSRDTLTVNKLVEICEHLDYEVTIQPKRGGRRPRGTAYNRER